MTAKYRLSLTSEQDYKFVEVDNEFPLSGYGLVEGKGGIILGYDDIVFLTEAFQERAYLVNVVENLKVGKIDRRLKGPYFEWAYYVTLPNPYPDAGPAYEYYYFTNIDNMISQPQKCKGNETAGLSYADVFEGEVPWALGDSTIVSAFHHGQPLLSDPIVTLYKDLQKCNYANLSNVFTITYEKSWENKTTNKYTYSSYATGWSKPDPDSSGSFVYAEDRDDSHTDVVEATLPDGETTGFWYHRGVQVWKKAYNHYETNDDGTYGEPDTWHWDKNQSGKGTAVHEEGDDNYIGSNPCGVTVLSKLSDIGTEIKEAYIVLKGSYYHYGETHRLEDREYFHQGNFVTVVKAEYKGQQEDGWAKFSIPMTSKDYFRAALTAFGDTEIAVDAVANKVEEPEAPGEPPSPSSYDSVYQEAVKTYREYQGVSYYGAWLIVKPEFHAQCEEL